MVARVKKGAAVVLALLMMLTLLPFVNPSQTYAEDATIESVRTAILALSADPTSYTADDKEHVEAIWADFQSLSAADQATLDSETTHTGTGQPLGRVLESALWSVWSYAEIDNSTTLGEGVYNASSTPALSSAYSKGKSSSGRQKPWSVKDVTVDAEGNATATITVESDSYSGIWIGGTTYPKTNSSGNCEFAGVPIDLNSTFYFAGISTSMPTPIAFSLTTEITEPDPSSEPEKIDLGITNNTGMFNAVTAYLEKTDDATTLVMALSGTGYKELFKGTYEQAVANGDGSADKGNDSWIHGATNDAGLLEFRIPINAGETYVPCVAISNSYYTKYLNGTNALERAFYPRQFEVNEEAKTLVTGDYDETADFAVTSNVADFKVADKASTRVVGGPNSNNYNVAPTLVMQDATYDKVTYPTVVNNAIGTATADLTDGKFEISLLNAPNKEAFKDKTPIEMTFHVAEDAPYAEAGTDVVRNVTIDKMAKTITIEGTPLTEKGGEPEKIDLEITNNTGMFKAATAYLEKTDDATTLVMALSGTGYKELFKGTYEQAVANGDGSADKGNDSWIHGATNADGLLEFRIPINAGETYVPCVAISNSYYTKYLNGTNALERAFYPRQFEVNEEAKTLVTGDYDETSDFAVTSNVADFKVADKASTRVVGGPNSNNYNVAPTLVMQDATYDKVTYPTVVNNAIGTATADLTDGKFEISLLNAPNKEAFKDKTPIEMTFHVAEDAPYAEAGTDVVRNVTIDKMAKTITVAGEPLTPESTGLADGTYRANKVSTDVTTDASGMIMVTAATVVIKDGKAEAVVTMKGTGADRFYVSETATKDTIIDEAIAEEQKEVGGEFGKLIGGLKLEGSSAYSFWPIPITLGQPTIYAARSASHFAKQDIAPEKYYYVHDFQIDEADLEKISDSTDLPITAEQEAQRYLNQYFLDGKISTSATATDITGKNANVTVPYYKADATTKLSSFVFKMAESGKFRSGWFVDSSILNSTYFTSSNLKKIRYPEGSNGTVTFNPKASYRDEGMSFTATLKLYPADAAYNQYDADGVYYDKEPLAEQTFTITVDPLPDDRHVTINVVDAVTKEAVPNAVVTVTKDSDDSAVEPSEGVYTMSVPGTYTVKASAEGYLVPGTEDTELVQTEYAPKKDGETLTLTLIKAEDSKRTIKFALKDQLGDVVEDAAISVYTWTDKTPVEAEADGSYKLYTGTNYGYTITKDGYEETTHTLKPVEDATEEVLVNKYLSEQKFTFRVYDNKTNETLEGVNLVVKYGPSSEDESTYAEAQADENGVYTIPIDNRVVAYGSKAGYESNSLGVWSLGFDPLKECSFGLNALSADDVEKEIEALPEADKLTLEDAEAVKAAQADYDALSEEDKVNVDPSVVKDLQLASTTVDKLEAQAENAEKDKTIEEQQGIIDDIQKQIEEMQKQIEEMEKQLSIKAGWNQIDGEWYYYDADRNMQTGWVKDNGKWYFMNKETGIMQTGWVKDGNTWYYMNTSGAMQTGWVKVGNTWYYMKSSGAMAANEWCGGYWLNADGSWTYQPRGSWKQNSTGWWFGDTSGWYAKNTTVKIDDKNYSFDASGYMK